MAKDHKTTAEQTTVSVNTESKDTFEYEQHTTAAVVTNSSSSSAFGHQGATGDSASTSTADIHDKELSAGVARIEAMQKVWGKWGYIILLASLGISQYIYSLDGTTTFMYLAQATSGVGEHSLLGTVSTAGGIILAVGLPFIAKIADYFGRGEALAFSTILMTISYILYASANAIGQIAGAQILYSVGATGLSMMTSIILADVVSLRFRTLLKGIYSLPYVINVFVAAEVYNYVINGPGWRWGYGMFAILMPACLLPVVLTVLWGQWRARKLNVLQEDYNPEKSFLKHPLKALILCHYEVDLPGLILIGASLALLLLPLGLAPTASNGWNTPSMIVMLVLGCVLLPVFVAWELVYAEKFGYQPIAPWRFFKNYNISAACFIGIADFVSFYLQYTYQYSFVYVVKTEWSERDMTYFTNTQTFGLCIFGTVCGVILVYYRRPKWLLVGGLCLRLLGVGLMIHSRGALGSDVELVWCQLLQGIGGGFAAVLIVLVAQALVPHTDVAIVTALVSLITELGNSIGSAIATAVWTSQMPAQLAANVPTTNQTLLNELYSSILVIAEYPSDDPIRQGVITAYSHVMRNLCIGATVTAVPPILAAIFFIDDITVGDKQNVLDNRDLTGERDDIEQQKPKDTNKAGLDNDSITATH